MCAERIDGRRGCKHVLAFEKARDLGPTNRERPSISARCEIDLSPGTRILPVRGMRGRAAVRGLGISSEMLWAMVQLG